MRYKANLPIKILDMGRKMWCRILNMAALSGAEDDKKDMQWGYAMNGAD